MNTGFLLEWSLFMKQQHYDLIVAGGGFAGTAAAIAAARQGLQVLLFDKGNALGGAANCNLVMPFMRHHTTVNQERFFLCRGIFAEIKHEMEVLGGCQNDRTFHDEILKLVLNRMAKDAGVTLLFGVYLTGVKQENGSIQSLSLSGVSGSFSLSADSFIDATGDGALSVLAGCEAQLGRLPDHLCQPMTLCFRVANIDMDLFEKQAPEINPLYQKWQQEGKIKNPREDVLRFHTLIPGVLHFNTTRIVKKNPTDPFDKTEAEIEAREQVFEVFSFLKENFSAFAHSEICSTAAEIGVRESRMIAGRYQLTEEDLKNCVKFPDAIAAGNYDIDIHNPEGSGTSHYYFADGTWYTIPYRCLLPVGCSNLLVTGRCISATHEAQASIRIMPIVCCLGEAAGIGAAVAKKQNTTPDQADVTAIQRCITENGGFTGLLS